MIYLLSVGINQYEHSREKFPKTGISWLEECVSDVQKLTTHFEKYHSQGGLKIKTLLDQDATRTNIIEGLTGFLGKSKTGDTAIFHFSGHGSDEMTSQEFIDAGLEPEGGKNETLVCYNSKMNGTYSIADKELRVLLHDIAAKGAHVVCLFDCCHSGSMTKGDEDKPGVKLRKHRLDNSERRARPIGSYHGNYYQKQLTAGKKLEIPLADYIAIAACGHNEEASEEPEKGGVFTQALIAIVESPRNQLLSYADLFVQLRTRIKLDGWQQNPQFEYFGAVNPYTRFLDGKVSLKPRYPELVKTEIGYAIALGALQGLELRQVKNLVFSIYEQDDEDKVVGKARIKQVLVESSPVKFLDGFTPDKDGKYMAAVHGQPLALKLTKVDAGLTALLNSPWSRSCFMEAPEAEYELSLEDKNYCIHRLTGGRNLIHGIPVSMDDPGEYILNRLENIAKWEILRHLKPNRDSRIPVDRLKFTFHYTDYQGRNKEYIVEPHNPDEEESWGQITVEYDASMGGIPYWLQVQNTSRRNLYFYLLHLDSTYGIKMKSENIVQVLGYQQKPLLLYDSIAENIGLGIPGGGPDSILDTFLLICSTDELKYPFVFDQDGFGDDFGKILSPKKGDVGLGKSFGFMNSSRSLQLADWNIKKLEVKIVKKGKV